MNFAQNRLFFSVAAGLIAAGSVMPSGHAATVSGVVKWDGSVPRVFTRPIDVGGNPECARLHPETESIEPDVFVVGAEGGFANVLVRVVSGVPAGMQFPLPEEPAILTQKDCTYSPHVFVVRLGQPVKVLNPDAIQHNVHLIPEANDELNLTMDKSRTETTHSFKVPEGPFPINCDVHNWMTAWCAVLDHPFYAVTGKDGEYTLDGLPAGEYVIEAWHENEHLPSRQQTVKVSGDDSIEVNFTFTPPKRK